MSLVTTVEQLLKDKLDTAASEIERELKFELNASLRHPSRSTGSAMRKIRIEKEGKWSRFIGARIDWDNHNDGGVHLYYFIYGNKGNGSDGKIYPTRSRALHLEHIGDDVYAAYVSPYAGNNILKSVVDHYVATH